MYSDAMPAPTIRHVLGEPLTRIADEGETGYRTDDGFEIRPDPGDPSQRSWLVHPPKTKGQRKPTDPSMASSLTDGVRMIRRLRNPD